MDISSTSRTITETTHVIVMDAADQGALFTVAARNKVGATADAPASLTRRDDGSVAISVVVTSEVPDAPAPPAPPTPTTPSTGASPPTI